MKFSKWLISIITVAILLASCIPIQAPVQTVLITPTLFPLSSTADPCIKENLPAEVEKISRITTEFDELTMIAQSTPKEQLAVVILEMRRVRNLAKDMDLPECLKETRSLQQEFMDGVIQTMASFMAGASGIPIQAQINSSRELRDKYEAIVADMLGVPYMTSTPLPPTPIIPTSTPGLISVSTRQDIYVMEGPALEDYAPVGILQVGENANAIGRSEIGEWIQIELVAKPGVLGWVPKPLVKVTGNFTDLPIVPAPEKKK